MAEEGVQLVCFELCGEKFAFNMDYLVEIIQTEYSKITPFSSPIPLLRGKWDYRKKTIYIIDLRDFFGLENGSDSPSDCTKSILVVKIRDQIFGLLTDGILQVVSLGVFYEYPDMISTLSKRYFAGVTIIHSELVLILAIEEFINDYELDSLRSIDK
jgi:chemotaxis signal transduction protein